MLVSQSECKCQPEDAGAINVFWRALTKTQTTLNAKFPYSEASLKCQLRALVETPAYWPFLSDHRHGGATAGDRGNKSTGDNSASCRPTPEQPGSKSTNRRRLININAPSTGGKRHRRALRHRGAAWISCRKMAAPPVT